MSDNNPKRNLKVEDVLPVKAVGIECMKESIPTTMSPHRYLFKWFARRPTAATRLAVLASVLPDTVSNDELLQLMKIGPDRPELLNTSISDYVADRRENWEDSDGSLVEHYGYPLPHSNSPTEKEVSKLHNILGEHWDGSVPTVLDPTAGGGTIPMEAYRYGLPVKANELNPVAWLLNKTILEYAPHVGSIEGDVRKWASEIDKRATSELEEYFPSAEEGQEPNYYFCSYSIECPSCGNRLPLSNRWWFLKESASEGHAFRPHPKKNHIEYEHVYLPRDITKDEFDPSEGTVSGGDAECPTCNVVTERSEITELLTDGDFEFEVCGVQYLTKDGKSGYRGPTEDDREAFRRAEETIASDLDLRTLLNSNRYIGRQDRAAPYGIKKWREMYTPRQFLSHAKYLHAFEEVEDQIREEYDSKRAEAILVLLSLSATKLIERNSRLQPLDVRLGSPANMLGNNNFAFQWHFPESNITTGAYSYETTLDKVIEKYEEIVEFYDVDNLPEADVRLGDGADLPYDNESIEAVVIDPPYGDNVMYAELGDAFYVWLREYLSNTFSGQFSQPETNKRDEAVENSEIFEDSEEATASDAAREHYENKMSGIFSESYRVLESGGVITVYFTDKETGAWDALTMSLIDSGFTVTATHTITSEMPHRVGMQDRSSADSTLLLTCRKPDRDIAREDRAPTLWSDIKEKTEQAARKKATELLDSGLNLTKTDTIISAFGPTLRVFTENYPVVDMHDNPVRPAEALETARTAVTEVLIERELENNLEGVDGLTKWYILMVLIYERETVPYDEANQLGMGVGVSIDELKRTTKIWKKSGNSLILASQSDRVRDITALEAGEKRRKRAFPVDPREQSFDYNIDAIHAALNVIETKGSDFAWNWLNERDYQNDPSFRQTVRSLAQILPENHDDFDSLINLLSGDTGELLGIDTDLFTSVEDGGDNHSLDEY